MRYARLVPRQLARRDQSAEVTGMALGGNQPSAFGRQLCHAGVTEFRDRVSAGGPNGIQAVLVTYHFRHTIYVREF